MIDIRTVLVLGAGASSPYGFDTGNQLVNKALGSTPSDFEKLLPPSVAKQIPEFKEELRLARPSSIDAFLETRREFEPIGKAFIAYFLMNHEEPKRLFPNSIDGEDDWYTFLLNLMTTDTLAEFGQNKLRILTYNYDRSLEYFLLTALRARTGEPLEKCASTLKTIILHMHGQLGGLPELDGCGCNYNSVIDEIRMGKAMSGIQILHEDPPENDPIFAEARRELSEATHVLFLGFGYHEKNVERLELRHPFGVLTKYYGTAYGLKGEQPQRKAALFPRKVAGPRINLGSCKTRVLEFLQNHISQLQRLPDV